MEEALGTFEKYLYIWVVLCMILGLILSQVFPAFSIILNGWQIYGISIPIGICLFLMMYPALLNLQFEELKKLLKNPKPIVLTLISNWIVAPIVAALLAYMFLNGHEQLIVSVILLGSSPCTAMVLVWGALAKGNQEQNVIVTSLNTLTIMFLYAPVVSILTGIQNIQIDRAALLISVFVFIGIPLVLGYFSKRIITRKKGEKWFLEVYRPAVGKIAIFALLVTLIVLFSLNGKVLIGHPEEMVLVSIPLLVGFAIVVGYNLIVTKMAGLKYREAITSVIVGSSSHFEIAIATAVSMFGLNSQAALGTTMGLFWEVPVMLSLVYLGSKLKAMNFWTKDEVYLVNKLVSFMTMAQKEVPVIHVEEWEDFKKALVETQPDCIFCAQQSAPHSEKPLTLGLMFASKNAQHAFLDLAIDDSFKKTKIPTFVNKFGAVCLDEDNLKNFICCELGREDIEIRSYEV
ncbi:MAG: ACR3 family arsenite efflux transporter ArsB [Candidatus Fermentimicrarchaeum limneticum]|uniref:ACR3 family arsenite efflux transporter ArsB n=1 Tax=Fermentimicrarchaeum limneticum TaxID=2795018 RepID=A0A7D6BQE2_FERL1|nr:MAG: ACR3 family arsenite efflux transporter ArsB [Candidatus Fermentimicrarchaeum limneticum]